MNALVIHPQSKQQLAETAKAPAHAILLVGPVGGGKASVARGLAETILGLPVGTLGQHAYALVIQPVDSGSIGIEAVREAERFLSLKVPGQQAVNRVLIVEDAHTMTIEAQNALLKTLEEPPAGAVILLTASHERALLPTILSRVQLLRLRRPDKASLTEHFTGLGSNSQSVERAHTMSGGLPGLMAAVLADTEHPLLQATQTAREILSKSTYERLLMVDVLAKDKQQVSQLAYILQQMAHVSLQSATSTAAGRWQSILAAAYEANEAIESSAQLKLTLTNLMLHL
jgi:DNA polymerase-3 subunit delta'